EPWRLTGAFRAVRLLPPRSRAGQIVAGGRLRRKNEHQRRPLDDPERVQPLEALLNRLLHLFRRIGRSPGRRRRAACATRTTHAHSEREEASGPMSTRLSHDSLQKIGCPPKLDIVYESTRA